MNTIVDDCMQSAWHGICTALRSLNEELDICIVDAGISVHGIVVIRLNSICICKMHYTKLDMEKFAEWVADLSKRNMMYNKSKSQLTKEMYIDILIEDFNYQVVKSE